MTFEECFNFENLLNAHKVCRRSKTHKKEVVQFELNLSENLVRLMAEIQRGYKLSKYKVFKIYDPKERTIEALPYKDRLVQMALCKKILQPVLEKRLIHCNAACREGKGTSFALEKLRVFLHGYYFKYGSEGYFLKIDISKYFASINHEILKRKLEKCHFDTKSLNLMLMFLNTDRNQKGRGIPLGNQTSQWFALLYLDEVDRLIKEKFRIKFYIRYMDDLILIHSDKNLLQECEKKVKQVCKNNLKLELNSKTQLAKLSDGIDFLGFRTILTTSGKVIRVLRQQAKLRLKKKLKCLKILKQNNLIDESYILVRLNSFFGHVKKSNSALTYKNFKAKFGL